MVDLDFLAETFEEVLTAESYNAEKTETIEEINEAVLEEQQLEYQIEVALDSQTKSITTADVILNDIKTDITTESIAKLETTMQTIAMLNGFDKNAFLMDSNGMLTTEKDDKGESTMAKAKEMAKKLYESAKMLITKVLGFMSKWINKSLIAFAKGDDKRKELADKISKLGNIDKVEVPEGIISKLKGKVMKSDKTTTKSDARAILTFAMDYMSVADENGIKQLTGFTPGKDEKVSEVDYIGRGEFIVTISKNNGEFMIPTVVKLDSKTMGKIMKSKTFGDLGLDVSLVKDSLMKTKKDFSKDIDNSYKATKKSAEFYLKLGKEATHKSNFIREANAILKGGFKTLKGIKNTLVDATTIAELLLKSGAKGEAKGESKGEAKDEPTKLLA